MLPTAQRFLGSLVGKNVTSEISSVVSGKMKSIPVKPLWTKPQSSHFDTLRKSWQMELGAFDGGFGVGQMESMMGEMIHQAHFNAGSKEALRMKSVKGPVHGMIAGSGNDLQKATKLAKTMSGRQKGITLGTTSGGWLQNLTRMISSPLLADQGSLNASMQHGMLAEFAKQGNRKVVSASFSQGSHAASDSMANLGPKNLKALARASHVTMGGSSTLPIPHMAMKGLFDPVPLTRHLALPGIKGKSQSVHPSVTHSGMKYAKEFQRMSSSRIKSKQ